MTSTFEIDQYRILLVYRRYKWTHAGCMLLEAMTERKRKIITTARTGVKRTGMRLHGRDDVSDLRSTMRWMRTGRTKRATNTLTEATTMKRGGSYETQQWYSEMMVAKGRQRHCCSGLYRSGRTTVVPSSRTTSTVTHRWVVGREEREKKRKANPAAQARPNCICICAP